MRPRAAADDGEILRGGAHGGGEDDGMGGVMRSYLVLRRSAKNCSVCFFFLEEKKNELRNPSSRYHDKSENT